MKIEVTLVMAVSGIDVDQLRIRQEQRLISARRALDEAKKEFESAIALVETRERNYQELQEDVRRNLDALDIVVSMESSPDNQSVTDDLPEPEEGGSSRTLFPRLRVRLRL